MAKSRRPKTKTNPTNMPTDNPEAAAEALAAEPQTVEETPSDLEQWPTVGEPVNDPAPPTAVVKVPAQPDVPTDVLYAVLSKRKVGSIQPTMWNTALEAVRAGKLVIIDPTPPHINIKDENFTAGSPPPAGVLPINVLNNLVAGML